MRYLFLILFTFTFFSFKTGENTPTKAGLCFEIEILSHYFQMLYAPAEWKKMYNGWELEEKIEETKQQVNEKTEISLYEYHQIVRRFFDTTTDYHVTGFFSSTAFATLPFHVFPAGGKYFIVDPETPELTHGDELIAFDNTPIDTLVKDIIATHTLFPKPTDVSLALLELTEREGVFAHSIPEEEFAVVTVRKINNGDIVTKKINWNKEPENMPGYLAPLLKTGRFTSKKKSIPSYSMVAGRSFFSRKAGGSPFEIGNRKSYLPPLGEIVSENDNLERNTFYSYIFLDQKGRKIGYIRIPSYISEDDLNAFCFQEKINELEQETEALVIDQLSNTGGSVVYCYSLLSMLTDKPLQVPSHMLYLTNQWAVESSQVTHSMEELLSNNDEDGLADLFWEFSEEGFSLTTDFYQKIYRHYSEIKNAWETGNRTISSSYIYGIDEIQPHPRGHYTKPIIILVNELDFSGGDFFPAIMQDNKRAIIFGTHTSGAGGVVDAARVTTPYGLLGFTYTTSLAHRLNGDPIENLGVTPDVIYEIQADDIRNHFKGYLEALLSTLNRVLD